jgi:hypothetical protein
MCKKYQNILGSSAITRGGREFPGIWQRRVSESLKNFSVPTLSLKIARIHSNSLKFTPVPSVCLVQCRFCFFVLVVINNSHKTFSFAIISINANNHTPLCTCPQCKGDKWLTLTSLQFNHCHRTRHTYVVCNMAHCRAFKHGPMLHLFLSLCADQMIASCCIICTH